VNLEGLAGARVELGFVERALIALRNPDLRPAWREAKKPLRADQREHAKRQQGEGGAWPGRSPLTQRKAGTGSGKNKRPRKLLGRLPGAISGKSTRSGVVLTSRAAWSGIHKSGGTAGYGARIPARDFLWVSARALELVSGIIAKGLRAAFEKAR
jgi:phage gpG-like protein